VPPLTGSEKIKKLFLLVWPSIAVKIFLDELDIALTIWLIFDFDWCLEWGCLVRVIVFTTAT
jgi:hypothetical protein